jgi:hypothetical protein
VSRQFTIAGDNEDAWQFHVSDLAGRVFVSQAMQTNIAGDPVSLIPGMYIVYAVNGINRITRKIYIP